MMNTMVRLLNDLTGKGKKSADEKAEKNSPFISSKGVIDYSIKGCNFNFSRKGSDYVRQMLFL